MKDWATRRAERLWKKLITGDYAERGWIEEIAKTLRSAYNKPV